jgi:hypothetical protein
MGNRMMKWTIAALPLAFCVSAVADIEPVAPCFGDGITRSVYTPASGEYTHHRLSTLRDTADIPIYSGDATRAGIALVLESFQSERDFGAERMRGCGIHDALASESAHPRLAPEQMYAGVQGERSVLTEIYPSVDDDAWETWRDAWLHAAPADGLEYRKVGQPTPIPIPGTAVLGMVGLSTVGWMRRRL